MRIILPPLKWDKTNDGLDVGDFARWLVEYERSHLPADTLFPRPGQVWETVRDCQVSFEACMASSGPRFSKVRLPNGVAVTLFGLARLAHSFPFGTARLEKEERVRVLESAALGVNLQPLRYEELEGNIIPQELRAAPGYRGYRLYVKTARPKCCLHPEAVYLNEDFRLVEEVA